MAVDYSKILQDISQNGYATQAIQPEIRDLAFEFTAAFYDLPASRRIESIVSPGGGVIGYIPSEAELEVLRFSGHEVPEWIASLKRPRGYSSLDVIPPQCSQITDVSLFRRNPDLDSLNLSSKSYALIASYLNDFATSLCNGMAGCWGSNFDISGYSKHPASSSTYGLTRFLKYSASSKQKISKAHTDYELLTVILADGPGLEIISPNGDWVRVESDPADAIIIAGDMFEVVSQGEIRAAMHRVSIPATDRHSVIFFKGPDFSFPISPFEGNESLPRDFREHVLSMQIRSSPHLQDSLERLASELGIRIPDTNPFRRVMP